MLYYQSAEGVKKIDLSLEASIGSFVWADFFNMSHDQKLQIERALQIHIPSPGEINDIEVSSRLYIQDNVLYMTASLIVRSDTDTPELDGVTFVLMPESLVTVRYCNLRAFENTDSIIKAGKKSIYSAIEIFCILIDSAIERLADLLEDVEKKIDVTGKTLFKPSSASVNFKAMLQSIGQQGGRVSKAHQSLVTLGRMLSFTVETLAQGPSFDSNIYTQMHILIKDISALNDHTTFLSNKINFLLDATLGLINIEQNKIIKILSVAAVIFSPPTLIASIYGMNFEVMPELKWFLGYPCALILMFMASASTYKYFCYKKWL